MDTDNPNMNNAVHDKHEWWEAKKAEHHARQEKMSAEEKMASNDAFEDLSTEFDAVTDWTEANWDLFTAKVSKWWNAGEIKADETI